MPVGTTPTITPPVIIIGWQKVWAVMCYARSTIHTDNHNSAMCIGTCMDFLFPSITLVMCQSCVLLPHLWRGRAKVWTTSPARTVDLTVSYPGKTVCWSNVHLFVYFSNVGVCQPCSESCHKGKSMHPASTTEMIIYCAVYLKLDKYL